MLYVDIPFMYVHRFFHPSLPASSLSRPSMIRLTPNVFSICSCLLDMCEPPIATAYPPLDHTVSASISDSHIHTGSSGCQLDCKSWYAPYR